ncbi:MAG: lipoate--protein ligase [Ruminococcaceae bacterium]|nr:lipoate--protein ligase [Oscillospiraceae bacterium]
MMTFYEPHSLDAAFHFAAEEYCMAHPVPGRDVVMIWQTGKCAMLGSNQIVQNEVDLELAKREGVQLVRRASGGGTIYTDPGTLLLTLITPFPEGGDAKAIGRERLAKPIVAALKKLGVNAELQGRNDMLVDGQKVSGLAQRLSGGMLCSHCSLLVDADLSTLGKILTVDEAKIRAKGFTSVKSRVTNIAEHLPQRVTTAVFRRQLTEALKAILPLETAHFTEAELAGIEAIRLKKYANANWTYRTNVQFTHHHEKRLPLGKVEIYMMIDKDRIRDLSIRGDFLSLEAIETLEAHLAGRPYDEQAVDAALDEMDLGLYLGGVSKRDFMAIMFAH